MGIGRPAVQEKAPKQFIAQQSRTKLALRVLPFFRGNEPLWRDDH
jgi:hypothetical protein